MKKDKDSPSEKEIREKDIKQFLAPNLATLYRRFLDGLTIEELYDEIINLGDKKWPESDDTTKLKYVITMMSGCISDIDEEMPKIMERFCKIKPRIFSETPN